MVAYLGFMITITLIAIPMWKIGNKCGYGEYWKFCIPIYNLALLCECAKISKKILLLIFLPVLLKYFGVPFNVANIVITFFFFGYLSSGLAKRFGKKEVVWFFTGGICFFVPLIFFAFDSSRPAITKQHK